MPGHDGGATVPLPPRSIHLLVRVDAPEALLLDPAVKAVTADAAPVCSALLHLGDDTGLEPGRNRALGIGAVVDRRELVLVLHGDDSSTAARQQRVIDPTLGALGIADPAPVLELGGDFDRQAGTGVDPGDVVVLGRAGADVDVIRFQADVARHREA